MLKEYDTSHSGGLNFEEIRSWLSRVDTSRENAPTDLEVDVIVGPCVTPWHTVTGCEGIQRAAL